MSEATNAEDQTTSPALKDKLRHLSKLLGQVQSRLDDAEARDTFLQGITALDLPALLAALRDDGIPELDDDMRAEIPQIYAALTQVLMQAEARGSLLTDFTTHLHKAMTR